ncbi:MAG: DUF357 domain-containing protein [Nanoarchaeota archaeon]|nr:DUF357 domain-containing protein [Nanoarchaeota archaeon]
MNTEEVLIAETHKWLERIEPIVKKIEYFDTKGGSLFINMKAYISDAKHFIEQKDYVRAFEAVIWSWSIYELCLDLGIFSVEERI